jgi:hypothetical protein
VAELLPLHQNGPKMGTDFWQVYLPQNSNIFKQKSIAFHVINNFLPPFCLVKSKNNISTLCKFFLCENFFSSSRSFWLIWQKIFHTHWQHCLQKWNLLGVIHQKHYQHLFPAGSNSSATLAPAAYLTANVSVVSNVSNPHSNVSVSAANSTATAPGNYAFFV